MAVTLPFRSRRSGPTRAAQSPRSHPRQVGKIDGESDAWEAEWLRRKRPAFCFRYEPDQYETDQIYKSDDCARAGVAAVENSHQRSHLDCSNCGEYATEIESDALARGSHARGKQLG